MIPWLAKNIFHSIRVVCSHSRKLVLPLALKVSMYMRFHVIEVIHCGQHIGFSYRSTYELSRLKFSEAQIEAILRWAKALKAEDVPTKYAIQGGASAVSRLFGRMGWGSL